jgi:hypothetical protein
VLHVDVPCQVPGVNGLPPIKQLTPVLLLTEIPPAHPLLTVLGNPQLVPFVLAAQVADTAHLLLTAPHAPSILQALVGLGVHAAPEEHVLPPLPTVAVVPPVVIAQEVRVVASEEAVQFLIH